MSGTTVREKRSGQISGKTICLNHAGKISGIGGAKKTCTIQRKKSGPDNSGGTA